MIVQDSDDLQVVCVICGEVFGQHRSADDACPTPNGAPARWMRDTFRAAADAKEADR